MQGGGGSSVTRRQAFAKALDFPDRGCFFAPSCLGCPLPVCVYEVPNGVALARRVNEALRVRRLRQQGASVEEIAMAIGRGRRTVYRLLEDTSQRAIR